MSDGSRDPDEDFDTLSDAEVSFPSGLFSDGTTMWVSSWSGAKLYAFNLTSKAYDSAKDFNTLSAAGNTAPRGIWSDGTTMWVADDSDKLYAYNVSDGERDSG